MLRLAADENFNGDIVRGLVRRNTNLDIVRVQDVGLSGADDPSVLQWAADQGRIVVTHDISTLAKHAFDRVAAGQPMPGVFEVRSVAPVGQAIDDLILLAECSFDGEFRPRRSCALCGLLDWSESVAVGPRSMRYANSDQISTARAFRCSGSLAPARRYRRAN